MSTEEITSCLDSGKLQTEALAAGILSRGCARFMGNLIEFRLFNQRNITPVTCLLVALYETTRSIFPLRFALRMKN